MISEERLKNLLNKYSVEEAEELGLTIHDQILLEQIKQLKLIKSAVSFLVLVTIIGIILAM